MERLRYNKTTGLTANGLRTWGMIFCALGVVGRGLIQNRILGVGTLTAQQLLELMNGSGDAMILATASLVLQAMETCAAPIFCILLLEGFGHTSDFTHYIGRVIGTALLSEIPYNLVMSGKFLDLGSRNPVFCMVLGLVVLYFYRRYEEKGAKNLLVKAVVTVAAVVWTEMLQIDFGACVVLLIAVMWAFRRKPVYRNMAGMVMAIVCTLIDMFFLAAPMGFLPVHMYNGEQGERSPWVNYLAYPAILLVVALVGMFLF